MTKISVLMPTYNQSAYLRDAVDSLLCQTFSDFELIVINDCSTDNTPDILVEYTNLDTRIKVISNERNLGVANSLNKGLTISRGRYIARMDSDDICFPERFARQVEFLDFHSTIGVVGTETSFINFDGNLSDQPAWLKPATHNAIVWNLLYSTPFCHPSVMMRRDILQKSGGYNPKYLNEDMELWTRLAFCTKFANLEDVLLYYRMPYDLHLRKLSAWESRIQKVSQEYIEKIMGYKIDSDLVRLVFLSKNYSSMHSDQIHSEKIFQSCLLLEDVFETMKQKELLNAENIYEVENILYQQTKMLVSLYF